MEGSEEGVSKGAEGAKEALDPKLAKKLEEKKEVNQDGEYLEDKADLTNPQGLINRLKGLKQGDDPLDAPLEALLLAEMKEVNQMLRLISLTASMLLLVGSVIIIAKYKGLPKP